MGVQVPLSAPHFFFFVEGFPIAALASALRQPDDLFGHFGARRDSFFNFLRLEHTR